MPPWRWLHENLARAADTAASDQAQSQRAGAIGIGREPRSSIGPKCTMGGARNERREQRPTRLVDGADYVAGGAILRSLIVVALALAGPFADFVLPPRGANAARRGRSQCLRLEFAAGDGCGARAGSVRAATWVVYLAAGGGRRGARLCGGRNHFSIARRWRVAGPGVSRGPRRNRHARHADHGRYSARAPDKLDLIILLSGTDLTRRANSATNKP